MTAECGGFGQAERIASGFRITTDCVLPVEDCVLKQQGLCPREVTKTFAEMSQETGGALTPREIYDRADALIPPFSIGATNAVGIKCAQEQSKQTT